MEALELLLYIVGQWLSLEEVTTIPFHYLSWVGLSVLWHVGTLKTPHHHLGIPSMVGAPALVLMSGHPWFSERDAFVFFGAYTAWLIVVMLIVSCRLLFSSPRPHAKN